MGNARRLTPRNQIINREQTALIRERAGSARGSCQWFIYHRKSLRVEPPLWFARISFSFSAWFASLLCSDSERRLWARSLCGLRGQNRQERMPQNAIRPARLALRRGLSASSFRVFCIFQELPEQNEGRSVGVTQGGTSTCLVTQGLCVSSPKGGKKGTSSTCWDGVRRKPHGWAEQGARPTGALHTCFPAA